MEKGGVHFYVVSSNILQTNTLDAMGRKTGNKSPVKGSCVCVYNTFNTGLFSMIRYALV